MFSVVCVCKSVCSQGNRAPVDRGSPCGHYLRCIIPHCTGLYSRHEAWVLPAPSRGPAPQVAITIDLFKLVHLKTPLPIVLMSGGVAIVMVGEWAVRILLECFLAVAVIAFE